MKILSGRELAGFVKERQRQVVAGMKETPKLLIVRDSDEPVISKYVELKKAYGADIGVLVEDFIARNEAEMMRRIEAGNRDEVVAGIIVQLPIRESEQVDKVVGAIRAEKDVDGLSGQGQFDSATATAINWLMAGYDIDLTGQRVAIVGRGRLVGAPLYRMWKNSGIDVSLFHRGDDLAKLRDFGVVVTATGQPRLIRSEMVRAGAVVVDAGTASDGGVLVGDVDEAVRERKDLAGITPILGGVGPLTVACLFENVLKACNM